MAGLSPKLPLSIDEIDGAYKLNKGYGEMIRQNFKTLVLTEPGERIMDPDFGVGIKKYLFENNSNFIRSEIISRITTQMNKYMPFLALDNVLFDEVGDNGVLLTVHYYIKPLNVNDTLSIEA